MLMEVDPPSVAGQRSVVEIVDGGVKRMVVLIVRGHDPPEPSV